MDTIYLPSSDDHPTTSHLVTSFPLFCKFLKNSLKLQLQASLNQYSKLQFSGLGTYLKSSPLQQCTPAPQVLNKKEFTKVKKGFMVIFVIILFNGG